MRYQLDSDLSYCTIDGHLIFLDLRNDRYFRLSSAMERSFLNFVEGKRHPDVDLEGLIAHEMLVDANDNAGSIVQPSVGRPARSAIERSENCKSIPVDTCVHVFWIVYSTWLQLRTAKLKNTLDALASYRQRHASGSEPDSSDRPEHLLCDAAAAFRKARLYVPVETCCLPDSISMVRFLARQGLYANLVFGVMNDPLSAHCWVQAGPLVLNDTTGNANAHTPIRVV
ncbi:lasso peptide biosynthesis B2 protein [Luteimonas sp. BDR2-5]|uniref:lasso peptide biosynthesis B2 protein n=1 Tax=Proluteimonas luteida TaxID=2878685 RepID=UPI001E61BB45|nr:lasso peptide biosynthesis B2 protein [Luteimonas sp. BDR2-5]MCD9027840.1 lasso peptide biosynthesis B2 protein [Luteimonas sp. BDR2-5]